MSVTDGPAEPGESSTQSIDEEVREAEETREVFRRQRNSSMAGTVWAAGAVVFGLATMGAGWSAAWTDNPVVWPSGTLRILHGQISIEHALTLTLGAVAACIGLNVVLALNVTAPRDLTSSVWLSHARSDLHEIARVVALGAVVIGIVVWFNLQPSPSGSYEVLTAAMVTGSSLVAAWLAAVANERVTRTDHYAGITYATQQLALISDWRTHLRDSGAPRRSPTGITRTGCLLRYGLAVLTIWGSLTAILLVSAGGIWLQGSHPTKDVRVWAVPGLMAMTGVSTAVGVGIAGAQLVGRWRRYRSAGDIQARRVRRRAAFAFTYLVVPFYGVLLALGVIATGGAAFSAVSAFAVAVVPASVVYLAAWRSLHHPRRWFAWFLEPVWARVHLYLDDHQNHYTAAKKRAVAAAANLSDPSVADHPSAH